MFDSSRAKVHATIALSQNSSPGETYLNLYQCILSGKQVDSLSLWEFVRAGKESWKDGLRLEEVVLLLMDIKKRLFS